MLYFIHPLPCQLSGVTGAHGKRRVTRSPISGALRWISRISTGQQRAHISSLDLAILLATPDCSSERKGAGRLRGSTIRSATERSHTTIQCF